MGMPQIWWMSIGPKRMKVVASKHSGKRAKTSAVKMYVVCRAASVAPHWGDAGTKVCISVGFRDEVSGGANHCNLRSAGELYAIAAEEVEGRLDGGVQRRAKPRAGKSVTNGQLFSIKESDHVEYQRGVVAYPHGEIAS